jgi:cation:H+ antiporter
MERIRWNEFDGTRGNVLLISIVQALAGLAILYGGGEWLVRGAASLAARLGLTPLAIGLTVVAFGTSMPELVVAVDAVLTGANDISIGAVIGSNVSNIALILGVSALIRPAAIHAKVVRIDAPLLVLASVGLVLMLADGSVSRGEGGILLLGLTAYVVFTMWEAKREPSRAVRREFAEETVPTGLGPGLSVGLVMAGCMLLVVGGHLLVNAAVALAGGLGVSQAVIGLSVVAIGTSLPELAASIVAAWRGHGDIAIGNVVGSCIFNAIGIVGAAALVQPLARGGIGWADLGMMIAVAVALAALLWLRARLGRLEGGFLLASFALYLTWLFLRAPAPLPV